MKDMRIRSHYVRTSTAPVVQIADDEQIVGADHEGNDWWIYIAHPVRPVIIERDYHDVGPE